MKFLNKSAYPYLTKTWKPDLSIVKSCLFQILSRHGACFVWTWTCLNQDSGRYGFYHKSRSDQGLIQTWGTHGSDLVQICSDLTHICSRSESDLEQICFCDRIHTCLSPDSDMSMSKRNMHHVWTRSDKGKILRCSDLVSKLLLDRFPLTKISKRLRGRSIQGSKNSFDQFFTSVNDNILFNIAMSQTSKQPQ